MAATALAWLLGACALLWSGELPATGVPYAACAAGALVSLLLRHPAAFACALGYTLAWTQCAERVATRLDPALEGRTLELSGTVASVPYRVGGGYRFVLATRAGTGLPRHVELTWYEPEWRPRAAERLELEVRLRRPRGFANPGGADHEARLLREDIGATGYVREAHRLPRRWADVACSPVLVARDGIAVAIIAALGERPATGIVVGLAVGLQDALSQQQWRELSRSGTSHLMAISGMHVGLFALVAGGFAACVQRWRQRHGALGAARDVAVLAGSVAALGYGALAGWSVPTQRTAIMITVAAIVLRSRRRIGAADALGLGAIAVLACEPLAPLAAGFWLSFGAVAAILAVATGRVRLAGPLRSWVHAQWAVTAGLLPVLVGSFGNVSLVSAAVNLLAIPLYTLVVVPVVLLATVLLLLVPAVGHVALQAVAWLIESSWPLIAVPAGWPWAAWGVAGLPAWAWVALACGAVAALAPLPAAGRLAGGLIAVAVCAWRPAPLDHGAARFTLLDVGQGLAAVVETRHHVLVYDAGPEFRSGGDTGAMVVEPYLRWRGLRRVDALVASHDDTDHAGGMASIEDRLPVLQRYASGRALDAYGPVEPCLRGAGWEWDGVRFEWLHPGPVRAPGDNDGSCVLRVRTGPHVLLLSGDVERPAEAEILADGRLDAVDVLLVPHHGSRTSSSAWFVATTQPRWALVAAGHRNRWGFPRPEVTARWEQAGARVLVTSQTGAVEFELDPRRPLEPPQLWRTELRRPWRDP